MSVGRRWHLASRRRLLQVTASQVLNGAKEMRVAAREVWTVERLVHLLAAIAPQPPTSPVVSMDPSGFHLFWPHEKQQTGKRFATDADVKQAVSTWKSDVHGLLLVSHVCIEIRVKVWAPKCLLLYIYVHTHTHIYIYIYTGCPRRNVPDCRRVFLMLKYIDIT